MMKAIILAAGKSTRLLPLTKDIPACLLEVAGKTILERQIGLLRDSSVYDITVVAGHGERRLSEACANLGIKCLYDPCYDIGGIAFSLWVARHEIDEDTIVLYSDILFDKGLIKGLMQSPGELAIVIDKLKFDEESEKVFLTAGNISGVRKSTVNKDAIGEFIGLLKVSRAIAPTAKKALDSTIKVNRSSRLTDFLNLLIEDHTNVEIVYNEKPWFDIDFEKDLTSASGYYHKIN